MPAVAIVAAVGTVSAGAAMGGVLGGIMMAGGVMTGLGAVTGNKNLQRIGMVASLGAGIGSAMGLAGAANNAWNSVVGGADSALGVTGNSFLATGGSMEAIGNAIGYNSAPAAGAVATANSAPLVGADGAANPGAFSLTGPARPDGLVANVNSSAGAIGDPISLQAGNAQGLVSSVNSPAAGLLQAPAVTTDALLQRSAGNGSFISNAMDFLRDKNNAAIITTGGGLISGAMQSYSAQNAADAEYERRRQTDAEARARYNASITNQPRTLFRG